jgi:catechol 2,3-dioxygenase-like lactoylglutathione lyase family enzyme
MRPTRLDHVALWVPDPDATAAWTVDALGFHVVERTERFTLVGADGRAGKLTLFVAEGEREPGPLLRVGVRVPGLDEPEEADAPGGLRVRLVPAPAGTTADLDHVALVSSDPSAARRRWLELGFREAPPSSDRLEQALVGDAALELHQGEAPATDRPLLNHLGVLVGSTAEVESAPGQPGLGAVELVDAPNTLAAFVDGPDGVRLEYVAHKPSFSLV